MHELSVAESILKLTEEKILKYPDKKPVKITLEIGLLSGIDFDALDFAMQSVIKDTSLENTLIEIVKIEPFVRCKDCNSRFSTTDYLVRCPDCGNLNVEFIQGKELIIRTIELE